MFSYRARLASAKHPNDFLCRGMPASCVDAAIIEIAAELRLDGRLVICSNKSGAYIIEQYGNGTNPVQKSWDADLVPYDN
jgi:hypothetical protein